MTEISEGELDQTSLLALQALRLIGGGEFLDGCIEVVAEDHLHAEGLQFLLGGLGLGADLLLGVDIAHEGVGGIGLGEHVGDLVEGEHGVLERPGLFRCHESLEDLLRPLERLVHPRRSPCPQSPGRTQNPNSSCLAR